ncbi:MAG: polysaccharide biosynthesis tyrosine autokinase [Chlorobiales bacterium]|nr:polysaccharide biosynthesis tyrosine autokinase [Chlorobiales bacterium]
MANSGTNGVSSRENDRGYMALMEMMQKDEEDSRIILFNYLRALGRGKWIILITFLATMLITVTISFVQKDVYEGVTSVMVRKESAPSSVVVSFSVDEMSSLDNEIQILKSRTVAEQVAYKLRQTIYRDPVEKKDTLEIIRGGKGVADIDVIAARVMGGMDVSQVGKTDILLLKFRSYDPKEAAIVSRSIAEAYEERNLKSTRNTARVLRQFLQDQLEQKKQQLAESEESLKRFMEQNRVVSLDAEATEMISRQSKVMASADEAGVLVTVLKSSLKAYQEELRSMTPKLSNSAVQATLDPYTKIFQQEIALLEVERDKVMSDPGSRVNVNVQERLQEYNDKIDSYKKKLQQSFERQVKQGLANVNNPESYQDIFRKKLATELELISAETKYDALNKVAGEYNKTFLKTPGLNVEYARLDRKAKSSQELYLLLEKRYQEALIAEEEVPRNAEVIDWAIPAKSPVGPNRVANILIGLIVGIFLGVGIVMLIQFLDRTIYTPEQAEQLAPLLATIPVIESFDESVREKSGTNVQVVEGPDAEYKKIASHLVTHFDPKSSVSEAYRALRTNVLFSGTFDVSSEGKLAKVYTVTSSSPKEGKSTTISNLAITIAQGGQKVLLIDTDLRRPVVHSIFGYNKEPGVTNYLVGRASINDIVRTSPIANLDILTSGTIPPNPSELIGSQRMRELLAELRKKYDIILFDSPPVIAVTDAQILAKQTDGVIIIISSGQTHIELAKRAKQAIQKVDGKILGLVLNNFDMTSSYGSYYKYYRYYNYYYDPKNNAPVKVPLMERIIDRITGGPKV